MFLAQIYRMTFIGVLDLEHKSYVDYFYHTFIKPVILLLWDVKVFKQY